MPSLGMLERDRRSDYQDGGRQRWSYSCQPCLVRFTANAVTYMSSLTSASILKVPVPFGAPGSSTRYMAPQVGQKSPWAMPLNGRQVATVRRMYEAVGPGGNGRPDRLSHRPPPHLCGATEPHLADHCERE